MSEPLDTPPSRSTFPPLALAIGAMLAIAALYLGRDVFVPLVLAVLLSFALGPVVRALTKRRIPTLPAVLLAVGSAILVLGAISYAIVAQLMQLALDLPKYQQIVTAKLAGLQQTAHDGWFENVAHALQSIIGSFSPSTEVLPGGAQPVPVTVVGAGRSPLDYVADVLSSLLSPLATASIVVVLVVFLLLEREEFRDRLIKLVSRGDLRTSTKVMGDASQRVGRYLLVQFAINIGNGVVFGLGLWLIGVPNALLWGLLAMLFRYIPFVGTLLAAAVPFGLAFVVDPGWGKLIEALILYGALEALITNGIEPRLYGSSTGLSALAVLVAAIFWATLWGPIGLVLATPLTVCLVVVGRHIPQLRFLEILLGSEPVLVPEEQLYQRLLAGNTEEAVDLAEQFAKETSAIAFYDEVAVPTLRLASLDRATDLNDVAGRRVLVEGMSAVVHELEHSWPGEETDSALDSNSRAPLSVLCIGGRTELDSAAADMIGQTLHRHGITTKTMPPLAVRREGIGQLDLSEFDAVVLVYLDENPRSYLRYASRRIRAQNERVYIVACLLNPDVAIDLTAPEIVGVDSTATSIARTEARIAAWVEEVAAQSVVPEQVTIDELGVAQAAIHTGAFDALRAEIAADMGVQLALVSALARTEAEPSEAASSGTPATPTLQSLTATVVEGGEPLVVADVTADPTFSAEPFLLENGAKFLAAAPIVLRSGNAVGALFLLDSQPRQLSDADREHVARWSKRIAAVLDDERPAAHIAPELTNGGAY
jgi:predicted PurR-regulated permease PerM/GAF domain-containing protein